MIDQYMEVMADEAGAELGDPRRCPRHPQVQTSSPDGMFDAPCGACEFEMEEHYGANDPEPMPTYDTLAERNMDKETDDDCPF